MANHRGQLEMLVGHTDLLALVEGLFSKLGLHLIDTGETYTLVHHGSQPGEVLDGADETTSDYVAHIHSDQLERLYGEAQKPTLSEVEKFRIIAELFTAATRATLSKPRLSSPALRALSGAERLIHVSLISPASDEQPDLSHTLIYAARQWLVIPGLHGNPQRRFRMTVDQTIDFQRHVFDLLQGETAGKWLGFARWYRSWRESVSVRTAG